MSTSHSQKGLVYLLEHCAAPVMDAFKASLLCVTVTVVPCCAQQCTAAPHHAVHWRHQSPSQFSSPLLVCREQTSLCTTHPSTCCHQVPCKPFTAVCGAKEGLHPGKLVCRRVTYKDKQPVCKSRGESGAIKPSDALKVWNSQSKNPRTGLMPKWKTSLLWVDSAYYWTTK